MSSFLEQHPFPLHFSAAVSRLLDDAGIPHIVWGDHIDCLYGAPICPALCSFVVPKHQVEDAEGELDKAGLEGMICHCDSPEVGSGPLVPHLIRPAPHVSKHWHLKAQLSLAFIASNEDDFLGLLPLTADHPNPLQLSFNFLPTVLTSPNGGPSPFVAACNSPGPSVQVTRFLDPISLLKVLLVLNISERSLFGLCIPWIMLLDRVYVYMLEYEVDGTPLGKALEDPGLAFLFKYMSARFMGRYTNEQLRRIAIKKSRYDLKPYILKQSSA
ncbi:hypothetical protein PYCCODRAFT_1481353 [Trametes coccinea BRFM310]|uniref:Uncharacterized protein n=1 Tax=Trametes coccinea (strain BRFM310) TaxID=1353009 RepID=A0A1Y2IAI1_TRAC3|nr:hypothetical protein PYCCODRAFT_1481353 [Trametes coccinea BRFM310]